LGGYIHETSFPYRNLIVVNPTEETYKIDIPVFEEEWIEGNTENWGLEIVPVTDDESFLTAFRRPRPN